MSCEIFLDNRFEVITLLSPNSPSSKYGNLLMGYSCVSLRPDVIAWLDTNTQHEVKLVAAFKIYGDQPHRAIYFEDDAEAIHFKMRWF